MATGEQVSAPDSIRRGTRYWQDDDGLGYCDRT